MISMLVISSFSSLNERKRRSRTGCPQNFKPIKLTAEQQNKVLDLHNDKRNIIAGGIFGLPKAKNMKILQWDTGLGDLAQKYVDKCKTEHNPNPIFNKKQFGENLFRSSGLTIEEVIESAVEGWYSEVKFFKDGKFKKEAIANFPKGDAYIDIGHFTQLIWADTDKIGCGISQFGEEGKETTLFICDYLQAGNMEEAPIYLEGTCKDCTCDSKFSNLCASSGKRKLIKTSNKKLKSKFSIKRLKRRIHKNK